VQLLSIGMARSENKPLSRQNVISALSMHQKEE